MAKLLQVSDGSRGNVLRRILWVSASILLGLLAAINLWAADSGVIVLRLDESQPNAERFDGAPIGGFIAPGVIEVPSSAHREMPKPNVKAASVVLMDVQSGQVLYAKNPHVRRPNASTTKIMTAILLIENCKMTEKIKASKKACETPYTSIHLKPGEEILARDLLMGMMVRSANDAAVAAAEHIAGSTAKFAAMMNRKAREIGCKNTHFITPNGLYAKGHYSTAYDLCLMARYAFRYPEFNEAVSTRKYFLNSRTINKKDLAVFTRCKFLKDYPGADGAKSGYVKQAGYCLVGSATRDGWRLICAVLKSDNAGRDTAAVMDYGFAKFQPYLLARANTPCAAVDIKGGSSATVAAAPVDDVRVIVPKTGARITTRIEPASLEAPIRKGTKVGTLVASVNGSPAVRVEMRAAEDVGISFARKAYWWTKTGGIIIAVALIGRRYGAASAKSAGRRRRRVAAPLRSFDRFR
ncbi:MAG: D-alanyl-D-alanine carboxypeptidase [Armatimonadetes bacterium]|nr:D-alanyl-D-alanine carboxypeptidase [Armatimonadota bacterium]